MSYFTLGAKIPFSVINQLRSYYLKRPINSLPSNHLPNPSKFKQTFKSPLKTTAWEASFPPNLGFHMTS